LTNRAFYLVHAEQHGDRRIAERYRAVPSLSAKVRCRGDQPVTGDAFALPGVLDGDTCGSRFVAAPRRPWTCANVLQSLAVYHAVWPRYRYEIATTPVAVADAAAANRGLGRPGAGLGALKRRDVEAEQDVVPREVDAAPAEAYSVGDPADLERTDRVDACPDDGR